jgi:hypothetical protein
MSDTLSPAPLAELLMHGISGYSMTSYKAREAAAQRVLDAKAVDTQLPSAEVGDDPLQVTRRVAQLVVDAHGDLDQAIRAPEFVELVQDVMGLRPHFRDVENGQGRELYIPDVDELLAVAPEAQRIRYKLATRDAVGVVEREPTPPLEDTLAFGVSGRDDEAAEARARAAAAALAAHQEKAARWHDDWLIGEACMSLYPVPEPLGARLLIAAGGDLAAATHAEGFYEVVQESMNLHPHNETLANSDGALGSARFVPTPLELLHVEPEMQRVRAALTARGDMDPAASEAAVERRELDSHDRTLPFHERLSDQEGRDFVPLPRQHGDSPIAQGAQSVLHRLREKLHQDSAVRAERLSQAGLTPRSVESADRSRWTSTASWSSGPGLGRGLGDGS